MLSLLSEVHFWTLRDDITISNSDFGAFRFYDKKNNEDTTSFEGKKSYAEKRGHVWAPQNKRPIRLKDNVKELEEHLSQQRVVLCQWRECGLLQIMFSSGLFVNVVVNIFTGDPLSITFDKFLVGKLLSDYVTDVVLTKSHLICSYNDSQLSLVYFSKPTLKRSFPKSFSRLDSRLQTIELAGPAGRRLERKLVCNVSGDMFVVWWHSSHDEVYPWSPVVKDEDRANVLVYGVSGLKVELLCHHRSEFELLSVLFSQIHSNIVRSVEQKVSRNGEVTVECSSYQISKGNMQKSSAASIALPTHVCCHSFSPLQDKLLLGCIDGSLALYDEALGVTQTVKVAFIPSIVSWHPDGGLFVIANERCQLQVLDASLAVLKQQLLSEDVAPANLLDITSYFRVQPTLQNVKWNKKAETGYYAEKFVMPDCLLLLLFERGPLSTLRFVGGGGLLGDIHGSGGFTVDSLVAQYLWSNQVEKAINLLSTLNWDIAGNTCLSSLQRIVNHLFKQPLTPHHEALIQSVLGCFHMPIRPMCPATIDEFKAPVRDLTRRFFHLLLRYKLFEKAFRLAIDLMDCDLFMDIYFSAKHSGMLDIADAALKKAQELDTNSLISSSSGSSHSKCSRSSCSECSESTSMVSDCESQGIDYHRSVAENENGKQFVPSFSENDLKLSHVNSPSPILVDSSLSTILGNNPNINSDQCRPKAGGAWGNRIYLGNREIVNEMGHSIKLPDPLVTRLPPTSQLSSTLVQSQIDRPKVKFSETVTQITLPDRLHTLPEEEEDIQSPSQVPVVTSKASNHLKNPKFHCSNPPKMDQSLQNSFVCSANSVGIPIVPFAQAQPSFLLRRNIVDNHDPVPPCHNLSRSSPQISKSSSDAPWIGVNVGKMPSSSCGPQGRLPSLPPGPYQGVLRGNSNILGTFKSQLKIDSQEDEDSLSTEEISALLPGSRKPLTSGLNSFEKKLNSASAEPQGNNAAGNTYLTNYISTVHDLSEEEENNGTIKIVHFGIV
ncbi:WD repeat-containing and planar cell polarity effector protein fritz [Frankliniella fusca]|uniref:WD repeat-containing and planar cell polarity effector protein fritz n=1 Tax=Frankliniella fusca TaxID=407009 RepID=A0AAE1HXX3_9NEOP|nr:WD repeat-containing and planar cell polarity effector protein fritz [Frankliniella fusca]